MSAPPTVALGLVLLAALAVGPSARAGPMEDGNAGLTALEGGQYEEAIGLFSRAIDSGALKGDDLELGLGMRGRAYLKKGDLSLAIVDLDRARRMKPDDADAQTDLVAALEAKAPASAIPGAPKLIAASNPAATSSQAKPKSNFLHDLGQALVSGAVAGLQAGLQGAGQDSQTPN